MAARESIKRVRGTILGGACLCVLAIILVAGLWPFTAHPRNQVTWLRNSTGLEFGDHANIVSSDRFTASGLPEGGPCSLEMCLSPGLTNDSNTLLAFYTLENLFQFRMRQLNEDLFLSRGGPDDHGFPGAGMEVDDVLHQGKRLFLTITSDGMVTTIYIDGKFARRSSHFVLTSRDLTGQLIVGNAPLENDSWSGKLWGLAVYTRELSPEEISQHAQHLWKSSEHPAVPADEELVGFYSFDERSGRIIHNRAKRGPDLLIPASFEIGRKVMLEPFWKEYYPGVGYYEDLAVNIAGFMPLGFFFAAYLARIGKMRQAALVTILIGFTVSLTIEILQAYIPTRDSGTTDLFTNTLGTAIGAQVYGRSTVLGILERIGL